MWAQCKGDECEYCKKGETKISSSLVMPNAIINNGVYLHIAKIPKGTTYSVLPKS